jgi:unsaturated rhamnogalacturonyl hydrolase
MRGRIRAAGIACSLAGSVLAAQTPSRGVTLSITNPIDLVRPSETIVIDVSELRRGLTFDDPRTIHVRDDRSGADLLTQAIDLNDDGTFEQVIFQTDLAPREARTFTLSVGARRIPRPAEFKVYGRFVRERRDDFAWENDRIAHRMYGAALETWAQEPLTSSGVDVWTKRTRRLVINDWYMVDDYHRDTGEGADLYSAGKTRGCGGNALWRDGRLYPSVNFRDSRVLANGPIRVLFELAYTTWDAAGVPVRETKRITLDAGHNLDHFESIYQGVGGTPLQHAVGIRKPAGATSTVDATAGILRTWETFKDGNGSLGCGVIVDPASIVTPAEVDGNALVVTRLTPDGTASYYAGFAWDKSGDVSSPEGWARALEAFARRLRAPVLMRLSV